jgi:hypothetical protein
VGELGSESTGDGFILGEWYLFRQLKNNWAFLMFFLIASLPPFTSKAAEPRNIKENY